MNNLGSPTHGLYARLRTTLGTILVVLLLSLASVGATAAKGENQGKGPSKVTTITFDAPFPRVEGVVTCGNTADSCPSKSDASIHTNGEFVLHAVSETSAKNYFGEAYAAFRVPLNYSVSREHTKVEWTVTLPIAFAKANVSTLAVPADASVEADFAVVAANCGDTCPSASVVVRQAQAIAGADLDEGPAQVAMQVVLSNADGSKLAATQYDFAVLVRARADAAATLDGSVAVGMAEAFADGRVDSVRMTIYP